MLKEKETVLRRFLLFVDSVIISLAFFLAFFLKGMLHEPGEPLKKYAISLLLAIPLWCLTLYANGIYLSMRTRSYLEILWSITKSAALTFLAMGTAIYFLKHSQTSRLFLLLFATFSFGFILLEKTAVFMSAHYVRRQGLNTRRILIVGTGKRAQEFIKKVDSHAEWGFEILGAIDDEPGRGVHRVGRLGIIGALEDIPRIFHKDAVDEVVFVVPRSRLNSLQDAIHKCETEGVVVTVAVDLFDTLLAKSSVTELDGLPLLHFKTTHARDW
jgi:FlaA1/EpsC-like NDP-sugar epimerase